ncbi:unnamed protein product, partial [Meganyctiphanes norvegica]
METHIRTQALLLGVVVLAPYRLVPPNVGHKLTLNAGKNDLPNFVLILTDDQDIVLGGIDKMKNLQYLIQKEGATFSNSFVVSPLCCPSRSSILTGRYVHNHGAINNSYNGDCSGRRWQLGPERKTFATHLKKNGYSTFFAGKYLNQYGTRNAGGFEHVPPGWDWWVGLVGNSRYYNYTLSVNGTEEIHGDNPQKDYLTNVIRKRALEFLDASSLHIPFFMMLSTPASHAPFTPESKYASNFTDLKVPRNPNFNIKAGPDKHWLMRHGIQPLPDETIDKVDEVYRKRLRTLLTVDDMIKDVIENLSNKGILSNTYVIFTSDNGYHMGQFSLPLDKREPYETDIRVPLLVKGPFVTAGHVIEYSALNIDLAPTILELAGMSIPKYMDGNSLKHLLINEKSQSVNYLKDYFYKKSPAKQYNSVSVDKTKRRTCLIEHSGEGSEKKNEKCNEGPGLSGCNPEFSCKCEDSWNNTYACIREISTQTDRLFCKWDDKEKFEEHYNMKIDPFQINNTIKGIPKDVHKRMLLLLKNLQKCHGIRCRELSNFTLC